MQHLAQVAIEASRLVEDRVLLKEAMALGEKVDALAQSVNAVSSGDMIKDP
jgi:hypothetical protein